jgi:hypothetical protein
MPTEEPAPATAPELDPEELREAALGMERDLERGGGDRAALKEAAWRFARAWPTSHEAMALLGRLYGDTPLGLAFDDLSEEILQFDPAEENFEPVTPSVVPEEGAEKVEPFLLLHALHVAGDGELDDEVVDRILELAGECKPLLEGAAVCYHRGLVEFDGEFLAARSLALLGEIGDLDSLPRILSFSPTAPGPFSDCASWGFRRISGRRPAETLEWISRAAAIASGPLLMELGQQIALMPSTTPGRAETLLGMTARLPLLNEDEREPALVGLMSSAYLMEGRDGITLGRLRREHGNSLSRGMKAEFQHVESELASTAPYRPEEEEDATIYDVCCAGFADEEDEDQPYVREAPKIGRNDPCWCGSGKKYKKCHLSSDEAR